MKAEPESRLENGIDVSFSIDDLKAKVKPEPWDGEYSVPALGTVRAWVADALQVSVLIQVSERASRDNHGG
jgi:hypothetical protein